MQAALFFWSKTARKNGDQAKENITGGGKMCIWLHIDNKKINQSKEISRALSGKAEGQKECQFNLKWGYCDRGLWKRKCLRAKIQLERKGKQKWEERRLTVSLWQKQIPNTWDCLNMCQIITLRFQKKKKHKIVVKTLYTLIFP